LFIVHTHIISMIEREIKSISVQKINISKGIFIFDNFYKCLLVLQYEDVPWSVLQRHRIND
jgi:predicted nucleotide-binding protein (sugar kinase/HSP70/actin superfamily)